MKVTKTADNANKKIQDKEKANDGCNVCPCCGENKGRFYYFKKGYNTKGIISGCCRTWAEGFFKLRNYQVDCYKCYTCGAEWESDKYEI